MPFNDILVRILYVVNDETRFLSAKQKQKQEQPRKQIQTTEQSLHRPMTLRGGSLLEVEVIHCHPGIVKEKKHPGIGQLTIHYL